MQFICYGNRGSIPTPATFDHDTREFGGNTTCYRIKSGDMLIILDAGSGLRLLGEELRKAGQPIKAHFFFSHVHWDHIQGFPFFSPAFRAGNELVFHSPKLNGPSFKLGSIIENVLRGQQHNPTFPVTLGYMQSKMSFSELQSDEEVVIDDEKAILKVLPVEVNHPGGCYAYRFEETDKATGKISAGAICTDHEHGETLSPAVQKLAKGTSVLLYDAAYTPNEYDGVGTFSRKTFGHSTWEWGIREAAAAGVERLYLIHHEPTHDDTYVKKKIESPAREEGKKHNIIVNALREGDVIDI